MLENMRKEKLTLYITITVVCMLLTSVILIRFKVVEQADLKTEEQLVESELRKEIANYKEKYNEALEELDTINNKTEEYKEQIEKNENNSELVTKELRQTYNLLGKTDVKGDGVVIVLQDNEFEQILESDISELINELKYAGAEAISINEIRLDALSDVSSTQNKTIMLNGQRLTSPYEVKAIGNQTYLYSTLTTKNGFIDYYTKNYRLSITIEKQKNIEISKSTTENKIKYIKEE